MEASGGNKKRKPVKLIELPNTLDKWCNFKFPKSITERASEPIDDFDMLTVFIFDKEYLTYFYLNFVCEILYKTG